MTTAYGTTVFCEDIRDEVTGKKTYIGVFASELLLHGSLPALLPQFAFAVTLLEPRQEAHGPLNLKIILPGASGEEVAVDIDLPTERHSKTQIDELDPTAEYFGALMTFKVSPLVLTAEGHIRVRAYKGDRELKLGSLRVRVVEPLQVDGPPASP